MSQKPNAEALFAVAGGTAVNTSVGVLAVIPPLSTMFIEGIYALPAVAGDAGSTVTISASTAVGTPIDTGLVVACDGTAGVLAQCTAKGRTVKNTSSTAGLKLVVCTGAIDPAQAVDVIVKYSLVPL